ncbi:MAG: DUF192 domain-containing protein [Proteobacteria bacterium]|nr:DUF192 domain-containing protein [Pseudomonadota bacterium]
MPLKPLLCALPLLLLAPSAPAQPQGQPQKLATTQLQAGMHNLLVQVAQTPREREIGLMWRQQMATHEGMIFIFEASATQCFWMRNTYLPLSVAYVADDGRIVNIEDMQPLSEQSKCSAKPVRYVLEMNQGWFAKRGIKPGFQLMGPMFK